MKRQDRNEDPGAIAPRITDDEVKTLLRGLAQRLGVSELVLDEDGFLSLVLDHEIEVNLFFARYLGAFVACAPMAEVRSLSLPMLERLLSLNLDWNWIGCGAFSIPPESSYLTYSKLIPLVAGDVDAFDRELADFGFAAMQFNQFIEAVGLEAPAPRPDGTASYVAP